MMDSDASVVGGSGANARVGGDDEEMQRFVPIEDLFKGRHFDRQIIVLCVSWYTSFKLSLRDLVIMMADRGISGRIQRFSGGSSATCRSSRSVGGATLDPSADRGGWTRPIQRFTDNGCTCTAPSTKRAEQSISFSAGTGT